jgi:hypothetical protein
MRVLNSHYYYSEWLVLKEKKLSLMLWNGSGLLIRSNQGHRWRDKKGTIDAWEIKIASIFNCDVPAVDMGQIYVRIGVLQKMMHSNLRHPSMKTIDA